METTSVTPYRWTSLSRGVLVTARQRHLRHHPPNRSPDIHTVRRPSRPQSKHSTRCHLLRRQRVPVSDSAYWLRDLRDQYALVVPMTRRQRSAISDIDLLNPIKDYECNYKCKFKCDVDIQLAAYRTATKHTILRRRTRHQVPTRSPR